MKKEKKEKNSQKKLSHNLRILIHQKYCDTQRKASPYTGDLYRMLAKQGLQSGGILFYC
jgi:hypothetical protein